ncbi:MAG TPA: DUF47 family protein [Acidimicrobiales bacterium]|nr:DUF47 family protein [Acidimicrobiales bacterium]
MSTRRRPRRSTGRMAGWLERLALSSGPDVVALLVAQGEVSTKALDAFVAWSEGGGSPAADELRRLEHEADDARKQLVSALKASLATPIGQEDLFVLSERCDRVVNRVKNIAGEAEVLDWEPDSMAAEMSRELRAGMTSVVTGFSSLAGGSDDAEQAAAETTRSVRRIEHAYRMAMADLSGSTDLRAIFTARELYRSYVRAAEALEGLSDRLWYALLAEP